jgi:hypothetical protein
VNTIAASNGIPEWHEHLKVAYEDIVVPLSHELKRIMITFKIMNEGELFCTNLNFNLDDEKHDKLIGDPGTKDEDAVKQLNTKLTLLKDEYRAKFKQIVELRKYNRNSFAKAVYFATYYNKRNDDYNAYVGRFFLRDTRRDIERFEAIWIARQRDSGFDQEFWERM